MDLRCAWVIENIKYYLALSDVLKPEINRPSPRTIRGIVENVKDRTKNRGAGERNRHFGPNRRKAP